MEETGSCSVAVTKFDVTAVAKRYIGLHPYVLIILYGWIVIMSSSIYYNWPSMSRLMIRNGIYEWHCDPLEIEGKDVSEIKCEAQRLHLAHLFVVIHGVDMTASLITGFIIERYTQRYVLVAGELCACLAWSMLAMGLKSDFWVAFAFSLVGLSGACIFMVCLNVLEFFPDNRGFAICFLISLADDLSVVVPLILNGIYTLLGNDKFYLVSIVYLLSSALPGLCIAFLAMPNKSWSYYIKKYKQEELAASVAEVETPENLGCAVYEEPKKGIKGFLSTVYEAFAPSLRYACSLPFAECAITFIVMAHGAIFMQNLFLKNYDHDAQMKLASEIMLAFAPIPGILMGICMDKFGIVRISFLITIAYAAIFVLLHLKTTWSGYTAITLLMCIFSAVYPVMVAYIVELFPADIMTPLTGIMLFIGGVVALVGIEHHLLATDSVAPIIGIIVALGVNMVIYIFLGIRIRTIKNSNSLLDIPAATEETIGALESDKC
ncbi:bifunctional Major facilitator superfamily/MFS transporter superfamily [Babesia duncani]|uniref:Bifunctional Major facilitator superfamily/MFS transporter superfamily n=1 Tax=Babesia duncani TaxID=323732 RepID=A0AAD9PM60_9APIC|nr:bifunctional Major facilitator superfamily/MFS transporter superfamily [Babesia duncani]